MGLSESVAVLGFSQGGSMIFVVVERSMIVVVERNGIIPEGSLGRTAQDVHLDSRTAPEL